MRWLLTDQGSHFKTTLMKNLTDEMQIRHHFTIAYCPWSNGTVERLCKEILRIARALLSEWKLAVGRWPAVIDAIQRVVNHSPVERLGRSANGNMRCPMEVFSGLKPPSLIVRPLPMRTYRDMETLNAARCQSILNINDVHQALEVMHKEVFKRNQTRRTRAQLIHNAKTNVLPLNIDIGDYVMVRVSVKGNHKLQSKWKGPMRVIEARSDLVFVLEDINDARTLTAHAQRLVPYPITTRTKQALLELKQQAADYDTTYHLVDVIKGVRKRGREFEVLVKWLGFDADQDETWEPVGTMKDDLPGMLEDFLHTSGDRNLKRQIIDLYF